MALRSTTLFLIIISYNFASCHLLPGGKTTREIEEKVREQRRIGQTRIQDRQPRSGSTLKVLDFSTDNDQEPDSNGEYTSATMEAGPLPESFTICSAFMVEAWTIESTFANMFTLIDNDGDRWGYINLYAASSYTEYDVRLGPFFFSFQTETVFFPIQWSRACLSLDLVASKVALVVDGQLVGEKEFKKEEIFFRQDSRFNIS